MDFTGTTTLTFKDRLTEIVTELDTFFDSYPKDAQHDPARAAINGVLSIVNTLSHVMQQTSEINTIAAGLEAFEQILADLVDGRPADERTHVYKTSLDILRGETP